MKRAPYIISLVIILFVLFNHFKNSFNKDTYNIKDFSNLPVQQNGRLQPIDTVARNSLLILSGRQYAVTPENDKITAIEWFILSAMKPEIGDEIRVFKIEFPDELGLSGLSEISKRYYSFNDLKPYFNEIDNLYNNIEKEDQKRNAYERQINELYNNLVLYNSIIQTLHPTGDSTRLDGLVDEYKTYQELIYKSIAEISKKTNNEEYNNFILQALVDYGDNYLELSKATDIRIIPQPYSGDISFNENWNNPGSELLNALKGKDISPILKNYASITMSFRSNDSDSFNQNVELLNTKFKNTLGKKFDKITFERWFNTFNPFTLSIQFYIISFILICLSYLKFSKELNSSAFIILVVSFILHTFGLFARMYIQDRPPVTNLYSSAIFVGWGAVFLGIFLERIYRNGIGASMSAIIGFTTLLIAHYLALSGDTLEMMQAVLDSNFWLATHVIIITLGYSAMFLAGFLAISFIILGIFSSKFKKKDAKSLYNVIYGVVCFGTLFSLVGTILGGIWADQSWGRFWGWDPKENGALMIVLMGAIILHARWGNILKERGIMILAIFGNIVTSWSWFGTNLLGVGLHSYGFTSSGFYWLLIFFISQLFFIILASLPLKYWNSKFNS